MTPLPDSEIIANYLLENPDFFQKHPALLSDIKVPSPLLGKTISLQERQIEVLRDKYKGLELRIAELIRVAKENDALMQKLQTWTRSLLTVRNDITMPDELISQLGSVFAIPNVTLRLWNSTEQYSGAWFTQNVTEEIKTSANDLETPYCGKNNHYDAIKWFENPDKVASIAMVPLRKNADKTLFGLLILGAGESRFESNMATDFLTEIGETASAALAFLTD